MLWLPQSDHASQVSLDGRVYTVVCPSGAVAGEKIIVSGPDPRHTPLRIQPGSAAVGGCALAATMSSSSELYDEVLAAVLYTYRTPHV